MQMLDRVLPSFKGEDVFTGSFTVISKVVQYSLILTEKVM